MIGAARKKPMPRGDRRWQRRQHKGTLRAGVLTVERGGWVVAVHVTKSEVETSDPVWDNQIRLAANLGDMFVVNAGDAFAMLRVESIVNPGWNERYQVKVVCGACPDGNVLVMKGPKPR